MITSWYKLLAKAAESRNENIANIVHTMTEEELHAEFCDDYGIPEGCHFTAWGPNWVYFPLEYDGTESVGSAPRNPCDIKLAHQGMNKP